MKLYLMQHGKAVAEEVDPARPLSAEGIRETEVMAGLLRQNDISVGEIWHSKKLRSVQTADIISRRIPNKNLRERNDINPNDPVDNIAGEINNLDKDIMIAGHLPFLQKLASRLLIGRDEPKLIEFKYSSVLCLISEESWKVAWFITPDICKLQCLPS